MHALEKEMATHSSVLAEDPVNRGAWWAAVHRVAQSRTRLKRLIMHACIGEGNGNPLQYFCLENPRDGGAWWATVYGVAQSQTRLKRLSSSSWGKELREASSQKASKEMKPSVQPQASHFRD